MDAFTKFTDVVRFLWISMGSTGKTTPLFLGFLCTSLDLLCYLAQFSGITGFLSYRLWICCTKSMDFPDLLMDYYPFALRQTTLSLEVLLDFYRCTLENDLLPRIFGGLLSFKSLGPTLAFLWTHCTTSPDFLF